MLSLTIQSVKQTKNSYGGQVHLRIIMAQEILKLGTQQAALHLLFAIGKNQIK